MNFNKTGFILYTINYEACLQFYGNILGLPILYQKETLTCFDFGGSYLMVEIDDESGHSESKAPERDRVCLRLNVSDVSAACQILDQHHIPYDYQAHTWGTIAKFRDPDGNLIGFRSAQEHISDIKSTE